MLPRKRRLLQFPNNGHDPNQPFYERLDEAEIDDIDFIIDEEIERVYDEPDTDTENPSDIPPHMRRRTVFTQGTVYIMIIALMSMFLLFINYINMKQLEQLKEKHGFDEKVPTQEVWWQKSLIYHIYVRSFKDSNGDGIGDINGVRQHLDHLQYLGIDVVLLSCIYESPMIDFGKDVTDFMMIDPIYGTVKEFDLLLAELHQRGIKLFLEMIPNHTSMKHDWFVESRKGGRRNKYRNYYIWHSGHMLPNKTRIPPNNWLSRYGGSAWTWDDKRAQYYYHYYHSSMPDINYRENKIKDEMITIYQFWIERGVDGFLMDGVHVMFETDDIELDEALTEKDGVLPHQYEYTDHSYTEDQPDIHEYLGTWKEYVEELSIKVKKNVPVLVATDDDRVTDIIKYYDSGTDGSLSHNLMKVDDNCGGRCVHDLVDSWLGNLPDDKYAIWRLSSPDFYRITQKKSAIYQSALNMLILMLPGAAITYYGDEIGMEAISLDYKKSMDLLGRSYGQSGYQMYSRDVCRSPMQWDNSSQAGFTSGHRTWLPVHSNYPQVNVENQMLNQEGSSTLQVFSRLSHLRKQASFHRGKLQYAITNDDIFSFLRFAKDSPPYLVTLNLGTKPSTNDYSFLAGVQHGKVVAYAKPDQAMPRVITEASKIDIESLTLYPGEGLVIMLIINL